MRIIREEVIRGLRARRVAEQETPGVRFPSGTHLKGGRAMKKTVLQYAGPTTALVVIGWLSFLVGQLMEFPLVSIPLLAIARVLP